MKNEYPDLFRTQNEEEFILYLPEKKTIALVAHDNRKRDLLGWVTFNKNTLSVHNLIGTGTTGAMIGKECGLTVKRFQSGPLGGDQQIGAEISLGSVDILIFFWDPLMAQPHDPDVKALLRLSVLYNVPTACNRSTADFLISSQLFHKEYDRKIINYATRRPPVP